MIEARDMAKAEKKPAASGGETLLECRNIVRRFGRLVAVNRLSFELKKGEILGIGGPNGAGKTTLFDTISGYMAPSEGEIRLNGRIVSGRRPHEICHLGIARTFQLNVAFSTLTVFENVLAAAHFGKPRGALATLSIDVDTASTTWEALEMVGLAGRHDEIVANLPVVDRKRVMIASALATKPDCLMMDEPVGGLNPLEIDEMIELVRTIRSRGVSIILIEHVMRFLMTLSDRVLIMHHGEQLFLGSPAEMAHNEKVAEVYLGRKASARIRALVDAGASS
jgi:branched-chain amino acid transport system ATP-binding protein